MMPVSTSPSTDPVTTNISGGEQRTSLIEIFSAIQGEGLNVGTRQIFVRFGGCDLRCTYCDSEHTWTAQPHCEIEEHPGDRDYTNYPNPVSLEQVLTWVDRQNLPGLHDSISITGGEPLLHAKFLQTFLPAVRHRTGLPIYLETGGHRPQQLAMVLDYVDLVGMDIKLPSVSGEEHWQAHREFLGLCHGRQLSVFVKAIISAHTNPAELIQMGELVAAIDPQIPLFLQPVSPLAQPHHAIAVPPSPELVLQWQALLKQFLSFVRVIPQTHKMINQK
jgi:7-carboxy-7-deazaguanine synthase